MRTKILPKKSLGQSFLINQGALEKIINAARLDANDFVLEIGPGTGNLTEKLAKSACLVVAIEKDSRLIEPLKERFKNSNVEIIEGDILKLNIKALLTTSRRRPSGEGSRSPGVDYKIVANIPYYITSRLLRKIFEDWPRPELVVLTVQKEVAQRIMAKPPRMNLLALSVQFYAEPKIIGYVSRGSFRPMPKVDSAIIKLTPRNNERGAMSTADAQCPLLTARFIKLIKAGFSGKRKQLIGNLSKNFGIIKEDLLTIFEKIGVRQDIRAENLSLNQWIELSKFIEK